MQRKPTGIFAMMLIYAKANVKMKAARGILSPLIVLSLLAVLLMQSSMVIAQTSANSAHDAVTNPVSSIEIVGDKKKTAQSGQQCFYWNLATLKLKTVDGLVTAKGNLNGKAETMLVDTGRLHSVLTQQEAVKLGLPLAHSKLTESTAQGDAQGYATFVEDIALDRFFWHRLTLGVVSNSPQSLGMLAGADILLNGLNKDVEMSVSTGQMKIFAPSGCENTFLAYWDDAALTVPLVDLSTSDPRQIVTVRVNGHEMTALIDSGAPTSIIDLQAAARAGVSPDTPGVTEMSSETAPGKQSGKIWRAHFRTFSLGSEVIQNPEIAISAVWGDPGAAHSSDSLASFRLMSIAPTMVGATNFQATPTTEAVGSVARIRTEAAPTIRPDMLLGADFLRTHRVLLAMSQRQLYYTYIGGKVFGNDGVSSAPAAGNGISVGAKANAGELALHP
jgi:predicted aspartyl protease